ncbi:unnamed protein product [Closterium sp. Yama58-4]|nr:unnamed protein product [Closterium sp. Yama58-4]
MPAFTSPRCQHSPALTLPSHAPPFPPNPLPAFAFSDHFDRAFGFVFDCPQCLLYLVLASVPSALAAFLTALLLRISGGLVSSLVSRVIIILLLFPLDPFAPLWKVPQILTGVVSMKRGLFSPVSMVRSDRGVFLESVWTHCTLVLFAPLWATS